MICMACWDSSTMTILRLSEEMVGVIENTCSYMVFEKSILSKCLGAVIYCGEAESVHVISMLSCLRMRGLSQSGTMAL